MLDVFGNLLLFIGALFALIAAIGLYRLPGLYLKMHAATKAGTLGTGLILLGVAIQLRNLHTLTEVILLVLFISITNPISAHLIAKVNLAIKKA
ncbi:MAG: monovalent cation/H(+) antiporter subunit G [Pseudomonadota bacterium]